MFLVSEGFCSPKVAEHPSIQESTLLALLSSDASQAALNTCQVGIAERKMEKGGEDTETLDRLVQRINPLWIAISCGYMVSWTSIGSLISYFKARQGAAFYVALYCAFYLPGLPVSLLQQRFDENIDRRFGSANAFMFRVCFSMVVKILMLFILPFIPSWVPIKSVPYVILCCMAFVGTFSWLCHGTACQLCVSKQHARAG